MDQATARLPRKVVTPTISSGPHAPPELPYPPGIPLPPATCPPGIPRPPAIQPPPLPSRAAPASPAAPTTPAAAPGPSHSASYVLSIPAIVAADLHGILVSESAIAVQGCLFRTDRRGCASLRFPRGGECRLWREDGMMRLPAQIV